MIISMDIELIYKLDKDNLVPDALSRKEEFLEEKLHDTMIFRTIVYCDNSPFIKGVKKTYKVDASMLEIKKAFASIKTTIK